MGFGSLTPNQARHLVLLFSGMGLVLTIPQISLICVMRASPTSPPGFPFSRCRFSFSGWIGWFSEPRTLTSGPVAAGWTCPPKDMRFTSSKSRGACSRRSAPYRCVDFFGRGDERGRSRRPATGLLTRRDARGARLGGRGDGWEEKQAQLAMALAEMSDGDDDGGAFGFGTTVRSRSFWCLS